MENEEIVSANQNEETEETRDVIKTMTNLADSGQDDFVTDWVEMAKISLYEQGISHKFLKSKDGQYIIAKAVTDLIEDGNFSNTTLSLIGTLRINHPHSEDEEDQNNV